MTRALDVHYVALSAAPAGVLIVFCEEGLKYGPATAKIVRPVADLIARVAEAAAEPRRRSSGRRKPAKSAPEEVADAMPEPQPEMSDAALPKEETAPTDAGAKPGKKAASPARRPRKKQAATKRE